MATNDPDVPKLWAMLKRLRAGVESGAFTAEAASEILGNYADRLIAERFGDDWQKRVSDAWNRGDEKYRREVLGQ